MTFAKSFSRHCLFVIAGSLLALHQPVQAASLQGQRFQDWGGNCEPGPQNTSLCYLEQVLSNGDYPLMISIIGYAPGNPMPTIFFELPKGLQIEKGISLKADNNPPIRFKGQCNETRCTAGFALDQKILTQFRRGRQATVSYRNPQNNQNVSLPLSLMGISAGLQALQRQQAR